MQILNEFVISMIVLYLVAQAMSFQTKIELSHAHTTAQLFLARL